MSAPLGPLSAGKDRGVSVRRQVMSLECLEMGRLRMSSRSVCAVVMVVIVLYGLLVDGRV